MVRAEPAAAPGHRGHISHPAPSFPRPGPLTRLSIFAPGRAGCPASAGKPSDLTPPERALCSSLHRGCLPLPLTPPTQQTRAESGRLLVFLILSPLLSRLGDGFSWRWAFIMVWSEMRGLPNVTMALLLAYSDLSVGTEREKSQLSQGETTEHQKVNCPNCNTEIDETLNIEAMELANRRILSAQIARLTSPEGCSSAQSGRRPGRSLSRGRAPCFFCSSLILAPLHLLLLPGSTAVEAGEAQATAASLTSHEPSFWLNGAPLLECTDHQGAAPTLSIFPLAVSAHHSYQPTGWLVKYMSLETIKNYSESKTILTFVRKVLLNWVYNTKKEKGIPSRYCFLNVFHKIVFTDEFEYVGYLVILMNTFPIIISWMPTIDDVYEDELRQSNYVFMGFYILECLVKIAAMRKEYFLHAWNIFELVIALIGIVDVIIVEAETIYDIFDLDEIVVFIKAIRLLRVLRILKLITPKLLQFIDKRMSHQLSYKYAILKGYVQGEADIMTIIDQIASSKKVKQVLLKRITRNTVHALKELGYLEYDHPEIAVTMKTKEEINVMLSLAREIVRVFRLKGILHKIEANEINKLIMDKKRELLDFEPIVKPLTLTEALYHIPWLDKNNDHIKFIQVIFLFPTNVFFNEISSLMYQQMIF
ncbi:Sodium/hydrogen exchanger 10 [Myotis davidii]|uniref:Sodium/hydrogen exchanger 10 n=1 Tax=Myotis davidii TaxID=225400 RepID=L5MKW6_MYODS|nr:Sodium/hydrogen exchanger 10 [Myotis davidii]